MPEDPDSVWRGRLFTEAERLEHKHALVSKYSGIYGRLPPEVLGELVDVIMFGYYQVNGDGYRIFRHYGGEISGDEDPVFIRFYDSDNRSHTYYLRQPEVLEAFRGLRVEITALEGSRVEQNHAADRDARDALLCDRIMHRPEVEALLGERFPEEKERQQYVLNQIIFTLEKDEDEIVADIGRELAPAAPAP